jgi:hypothetical protein
MVMLNELPCWNRSDLQLNRTRMQARFEHSKPANIDVGAFRNSVLNEQLLLLFSNDGFADATDQCDRDTRGLRWLLL